MKVDFRPLNKGETYCCSLKKAKDIFKDTNVNLVFTHGGNEFKKGLQHPIYHYANKNVNGKVVVCANISSKPDDTIIVFYGIKLNEISQRLIEEFEQKYLPEIYTMYINLLNDKNIISNTKYILIEINNSELQLHKPTL